jgi:hypothetical protein
LPSTSLCDSGGGDLSPEEHHRAGADVQWARGVVTLRAEAMTGRDAGIRRRGGYVHGGVRVARMAEVIARVDYWDPDTDLDAGAASAAERDGILGLTWFIASHRLKLQTNLLRKTFSSGPSARWVWLSNLQAAW